MVKEEYLQLLLKAVYDHNELNPYDFITTTFKNDADEFPDAKSLADQLVKDKLAVYPNSDYTTIRITNFGKYWNLKGGYEVFLRDSESTKHHHYRSNHCDDGEHHKDDLFHEKEELTAARLKLTHYRLTGFWLALVISAIGFLLSLFNLYMLLKGKK